MSASVSLPCSLFTHSAFDTYSADAVLPNAAAGASAPMLRFESPASAGLSNFFTYFPQESKLRLMLLPF
jgi:hypothetical protein